MNRKGDKTRRGQTSSVAYGLVRVWSMLVLVSALSLLGACNGVAERIRRYTYPPDFKYIERDQLQSAMWRLAYQIRELDRLMHLPGEVDSSRRQDVRRLLETMMVTTDEIRTQGHPTNHPVIASHLEEFRRHIGLAEAGVESDPPNYFLVGTVSGACLVCHGGGA